MKKYFLTIIFLLSLPLFTFSTGLEVRYPRVGTLTLTEPTHPSFYTQYVFNFALAVIGILAFFSLVWAGFQYLTSAGDVEVQRAAKERMKATFLALLILLFSYLILTTFRREWGRLALFTPPLVGTPAIYPSPPAYSFDPLLHIHETAKTMRGIAESIRQESNDFRNWLNNCICENLTPSCAFAPNCRNVGCVGDPCKNRQEIEEEQIKLRIKLVELLFYHRLLIDATTEEHLTSFLWGRQLTPEFQAQLQNLRNLVEELEEPANEIRALIPEYTNLANEVEIDDSCEAECRVEPIDSVQRCAPVSNACRTKPGAPPLFPRDEIDRLLEKGSPNIMDSIEEIIGILQNIESFSLSL
jgi:hypothetical protein